MSENLQPLYYAGNNFATQAAVLLQFTNESWNELDVIANPSGSLGIDVSLDFIDNIPYIGFAGCCTQPKYYVAKCIGSNYEFIGQNGYSFYINPDGDGLMGNPKMIIDKATGVLTVVYQEHLASKIAVKKYDCQ